MTVTGQLLELPRVEVFKIQDETEQAGRIVEFRLIYRGKLPAASASDTRNKDKHAIRRELHKQLKNLWKEHPTLRAWERPIPANEVPSWEGRTRADAMADDFARCNARFLPLISNAQGLACSLEILFLRRDNPGNFIVSGGDIDNRLKVLFDALRIPQTCSEIPNGWVPSPDENPLYCLMEDDKLICEIKVTTDNYLAPKEDEESQNDVFLVIHVKSKIVDHDAPKMQSPTAEHSEVPDQESEVTLAPWLRELKQQVRAHAAQLLESRLQKRDRVVHLSANSTAGSSFFPAHPDSPPDSIT